MRRYGITGGIGSGKSYICRILQAKGFPVFNCDDEARAEMLENKEIHREIESLIGTKIITPEGTLAKETLAEYIHKGRTFADNVNQIVHPRVRQRLRQWYLSQQSEMVIVECALLFETGFDEEVDTTVVVVAPIETRIERVIRRDGVTREKVEGWLALQNMEDDNKKRADFVIFNDKLYNLNSQLKKIFSI